VKIILIGNGSSVLDRKFGEFIDSFDRVVRFNRYLLNGYEKFVGTKTTDWYNTQFIEKNSFRFLGEFDSFTFHSWRWDKECERFNSCWPFVKATIKKRTCESTVDEMSEFLDLDYKWFSTGAIAVWEMLKQFDTVHLYGFDWWDNEKHHYGDNEPRGNLHQPNKEKIFFEKLKKRTVFL
jgi:hypothetical protein